jgi:hypothetical protein
VWPAGARSADIGENLVRFVSLHLSNRWSGTRTNDMILETSNDLRVLAVVIRCDSCPVTRKSAFSNQLGPLDRFAS